MIVITIDTSVFTRQMPILADLIEGVLVEEFVRAAGDVVTDMKSTWPRRTGKSAEGFEVVPLPDGARLQNPVTYVPYVHQRGVTTRALDELTAPAIEAAIRNVPQRAADSAARRLK